LLLAAQNDQLVDAQSISDYTDHVTGAFPDSIGSQSYRQLTFNWLTERGLAPKRNTP